MAKNWDWSDADADVAKTLQQQLPDRVFDAHAHLYRTADLGAEPSALFAAGPATVDVAQWRSHLGRQVGAGRLVGGLLFPVPTSICNVAALNRLLRDELSRAPKCRGLVLVRPGMTREDAEELLEHEQVAGFKVYHVFSDQKPTFEAPIGSFTPAWAWELADERGLVIVLHMVRHRALADRRNQEEIVALCRAHPNARLVLAHAARGFHAPNTVEAIASLRGLENVWFDTSGVCEAAAIAAILNEFGPRRVMWGSDFPVSEIRGKCVTIGDNFAWISPEAADSYGGAPELRTWPVGLENLRAVLEAADTCWLNDEDRQDVFADNARRLLGLVEEPGDITQEKYRQARELIPGGTHLLSKRPEMFAPEIWPAYYREARGCEVWDLDGRHYYDMSINGIGACLLGLRDPDVTRAVQRSINLGSMATLNPPAEVELADRLCQIHPWADQVRLARTGGELASVAVRIARATTNRPLVAICGYHGWHDWYLAANLGEDDSLDGHLLPGLEPLGVPRQLHGTALTFTYGNREELDRVLAAHGNELAAVIMEPCRHEDPPPGFLEYVRQRAHRVGALLIFDEITIGWRLCYGGSHLRFGVTPDMALFAKALGNGHPIAGVVGTREAMEGGHTSFISSSYWTEAVGPAAALATLDKMQRVDVVAHIARIGAMLLAEIEKAAAANGVPISFRGYPCVPIFAFDHELAAELKTLYTQLMLEQGFLASTLIYVTLAHTEEVVAKFAAALAEVFGAMGEALARGDVAQRLKGPVAHSGFRRLL